MQNQEIEARGALRVLGPKDLSELAKGIGEGIHHFKATGYDEQNPTTSITAVANDRSLTRG